MRKELKNLREAKGYTQEEFAIVIGVKPRTYEAYEQGRRNPKYHLMLVIMSTLGTSNYGIFKNYER